MPKNKKSFTDYYAEDSKKIEESDVEEIMEDKKEEPSITVLENDGPVEDRVKQWVEEEAGKRQSLNEDLVREVLTEQRQASQAVLESITKTNSTIAESVKAYVAESNKANIRLTEAIQLLSEKVELLEGKLDAIKDLEIPRPVVNMTAPDKVKKIVHRDKQGLITHVEEIVESEEVYKPEED